MFTINNKEEVKEVSKRNILTNGILATYPFISSSIYDEEGIYIGKNIYNKSLIFIDRYDKEKYKNANMCVFGTSGAGKSYFLKLNILRYRIHNIEQYIIDSEREYTNICNKLDGVLLKIGPTSDTYKNKGITFDDDSLYFVDENGKKTFKNNYMMPILEDFYNLLNENDETKIFKIKLIPFVKGSLKFFNNYTNIKINNKLIIADIYELGEENFKYGMYLFTELFWDKIKKDRKIKKAIYIDEIWRLIGVTSNKEVASFIYKIFKTIRKYGGSAVAATQDISDLFGLEDGIFGKSILNNSSIKSFFALEEENIKILKQYTNISDKEAIDIKSLRRGECLMMVGEDHILAQIDSADYEKNIIE